MTTTTTIRPDTLEKLKALRNAPPRIAKTQSLETQLQTIQLDVEALSSHLENVILMKRIGEGLREARKRRKLSTRALAEQLQISQTRVVNVENANETLELQTIARFATQLGYRLAVQLIPENENDPAMLIPLPNQTKTVLQNAK
jgi:ribosome-binding protein aMBF1 (putative translation factor)